MVVSTGHSRLQSNGTWWKADETGSEAMLIFYFFAVSLGNVGQKMKPVATTCIIKIQDILFQGRKKELVRGYPAVWTVQLSKLPTYWQNAGRQQQFEGKFRNSPSKNTGQGRCVTTFTSHFLAKLNALRQMCNAIEWPTNRFINWYFKIYPGFWLLYDHRGEKGV